MKIQILSDLHLEFHKDQGVSFINSLNDNCDVLILAGDITSYSLLKLTLNRFCNKFKDVVYVLGNHEYYYSDKSEVNSIMMEACEEKSNLHWLNNSIKSIDGVRFVGNTMWFKEDPLAPFNLMHDFSKIRDLSNWVYKENNETLNFLRKEILPGDVVVTHHLPSYKSVDPFYKNSRLNSFFVCDVEDIIADKSPKLWIHGHTHSSLDYTIEDTRILCNPFGYLNYELNPKFKDELIVEL